MVKAVETIKSLKQDIRTILEEHDRQVEEFLDEIADLKESLKFWKDRANKIEADAEADIKAMVRRMDAMGRALNPKPEPVELMTESEYRLHMNAQEYSVETEALIALSR